MPIDHDITSEKHQYFDIKNLSARANLHCHYANEDWFSWVSDHMSLASNAAVLDVGCGPGWYWKRRSELNFPAIELSLIDRSQGMVREATTRLETINVKGAFVADATSLPFPDSFFDAVVSMHVLYHVADQESALEEAKRVLKKGGKLFVATNSERNFLELGRLKSQIFDCSPVDLGAQHFDLTKACELTERIFGDIQFSTFQDIYNCTDAEVVAASILSAPPGVHANISQKRELRQLIEREIQKGGGGLKTVREAGIVSATKS